jgi:putative phosphoribosyl transferase
MENTKTLRLEQLVGHGEFVEPATARATVVFVHGCGSARHSPHDRTLAEFLVKHGYATLLLDVLTPPEEAADIQNGSYRFNPQLLAHRLVTATDKLTNLIEPELPVAYIGVGTGAAAALIAASRRPASVAAVICRGGRPDLAESADIAMVRSPTLLIVGGDDAPGVASNRQAYAQLTCERDLLVVSGAGHLLDDHTTMRQTERAILRWLNQFVGKHVRRSR